MSGQLGSAITQLFYDTTSNTVSAGVTYKVARKVEVGIDGIWNDADASLAAFEFFVPADYLARNPNQSFDFTETHTLSDLAVTRVELGIHGRFNAAERVDVLAGYRYLDYDDGAPYLYETSGTIDFFHLGLGWKLR